MSRINAKPRKDESDERDEALASEDEIEHEVCTYLNSRNLILYNTIF